MTIREANQDDLAAMVALIEAHRAQLEQWQPRFWKRADGSAEMTRQWFGHLIAQDANLGLVHETDGTIDGFLIATIVPAPPVYDPGGLTCLIDDFALASDDLWPTVGDALVQRASAWSKEKGASQTVIIAPLAHDEKIAFVKTRQMTPSASWWVTEN